MCRRLQFPSIAGWGRAAAAAVVAALLQPAVAASFDNPFGMQLRRLQSEAAGIQAPVIVREAPTNESSIVARGDGAIELYFITKPSSDSLSCIRSLDGGRTWSEPRVVMPLPGRAYYAVKVLEAADGALHAVFHILGQGSGGYRGRHYEVYHVRQAAGAGAWSEPQRVVPGYVGSIRGFIQLTQGGRLVLAVGRAIPEREQPPAAGPDFGWNDTFVYYSDDAGRTWKQSPDVLRIELTTQNATRYGAIEPVLLELRDGRVWMLVRDRGGRLWQSWSRNGGERWSELARSPFISSDSPAELLRLRDGRIVLLANACQFWANPRTYAMGGRDVLQAAISADEGRTWQGFREVFHETVGPARGDRGTAYATATETREGKIVFASGQGEGKRAIVIFDPDWLTEAESRDATETGLSGWTQYGSEGLKMIDAGGKRVVAIPAKASSPGGAQWNFPIAADGELTLRLHVPVDVPGLRLCLNDHFTRVDDSAAAAHTVFAIEWEKVAPTHAAGWHDVRLVWNDATDGGTMRILVDGKPAGEVTAQRPAQFGVNYLRIEFSEVRPRTAAAPEVQVSDLASRLLR